MKNREKIKITTANHIFLIHRYEIQSMYQVSKCLLFLRFMDPLFPLHLFTPFSHFGISSYPELYGISFRSMCKCTHCIWTYRFIIAIEFTGNENLFGRKNAIFSRRRHCCCRGYQLIFLSFL